MGQDQSDPLASTFRASELGRWVVAHSGMIEAKPLAQLLQGEDVVVLANARPSTAIEAICPRSPVAAQTFQGHAGLPSREARLYFPVTQPAMPKSI